MVGYLSPEASPDSLHWFLLVPSCSALGPKQRQAGSHNPESPSHFIAMWAALVYFWFMICEWQFVADRKFLLPPWRQGPSLW
jgi:hypothetical protein